MANTTENAETAAGPRQAGISEAGAVGTDEATACATDDLTELEFTPLPPQEAAELEDRVYLLGARHGVRPF